MQYTCSVYFFQKMYYILNLALPCSLLSILSLLVFLMPPTAGDKIGFSITVFLAFSLFMVIVSNLMPTTSKNIPMAAIYLACSMAYCTIYIVLSIIVLNVYHQDSTQPVPRWLIKCLLLKSNSVNMKQQQVEEVPDYNKTGNNGLKLLRIQPKSNDSSEGNSEPWTKELLDIQRCILFELRKRNQETMETEKRVVMDTAGLKHKELSWQQAAIRMDRIFFWIFAIITFLTNLVSFICIHSGGSF